MRAVVKMDELRFVVKNKRGKIVAVFLRRWQAEQWAINNPMEYCTVEEIKTDDCED